jgi:ABC-2 type transport system ATP-binding protein
VEHVAKSFGDVRAVADVSFNIEHGEIFGLLGPNGAGKTTTIRLMLDIFKPEMGRVSILGGPMTEEKKDRLGYMPEERGLYADVSLERCLLYLATLKGMRMPEAKSRLSSYLEQFGLAEHKAKKVKELSKGMQQKAQIINTILHQPELVIIDEPFTALDPINTQLVKDVMRDLRDKGCSILMSTHRMQQVEELCDRIVLIDKGRDVLYGALDDIRHRYSGNAVLVRTKEPIPNIDGIETAEPHNNSTKLILQENITPQQILERLLAQNLTIEKFEIAIPTLDQIFIQVVERGAK